MSEEELTKEEKNAINTLNRLAKRWPDSLWLYAGSGGLHVMKYKDGQKALLNGECIDPEYRVEWVDIESDGGDW